MERLQKFMAEAGVASRRASEEIIKDGRVTVNGQKVTELGIKVDPDKDMVKVDGKLISREARIYIILNKPKGYVCTNKDKNAEKTVFDLIPYKNLHSVGRLDKDSEGLLLLTNDGDLTKKLTHPSHGVAKTYMVQVRGKILPEELKRLREGIDIEVEGKIIRTSKTSVKILQRSDRVTTFEIVLREGKKRQIRKMCNAIDHQVLSLKRIKEGDLELKDLKTGDFRHLNKRELESLRSD